MLVLVLNAGSSSLKFTVVRPSDGHRSLSGIAERLGTQEARFRLDTGDGTKRDEVRAGLDHQGAVDEVLRVLEEKGLAKQLVGVGHRVVHGGERFGAPALLDDEAVAAIDDLSQLAPLHNPMHALCMRASLAAFPALPQVAVFDTAFHQTLPEYAFRYAVPEAWYREHSIRRYGFHGTSHAFVANECARRVGRPPEELHLLTAHLGNGASATAVSAGKSVDTTMGLTPLAGLVMGTRSGDLDPAIVSHMAARLPGGLAAVHDALHHQSGLLGLSGFSNDMRAIEGRAASGDAAARRAIDVFCYRLAAQLSGLTAALPRLDALVFTGGIGEHSVGVRARVIARLGVLGFTLDEGANAEHGAKQNGRIDAGSGPSVWVIPTDEERRIAEETWNHVTRSKP